MEVIRVFVATANWDDPQAMERLFDSIPDAAVARRMLKPGSFIQMYDGKTERDVWILREGDTVRCITIAGIDRETGSRLRARFEEIPGHAIDAKTLADVLATMTGLPIPLVN